MTPHLGEVKGKKTCLCTKYKKLQSFRSNYIIVKMKMRKISRSRMGFINLH